MVRLHWIKVWDIKTEQVRDSFDSSGILFKAFWKRRLMCPIPGTAQKFPPIIYFWFRSSSHSKLWRGRGKFSEKRNQGHFRAKIHFSAGCVSSISCREWTLLQEICVWVTSVLFYTQRKQILCVQWLLQPLSSSKEGSKPAIEQQNYHLASPRLWISVTTPTCSSPAVPELQRLWWKHFQMCWPSVNNPGNSHHWNTDLGGTCPGNYRGITVEQEQLHPQYFHEDTNSG